MSRITIAIALFAGAVIGIDLAADARAADPAGASTPTKRLIVTIGAASRAAELANYCLTEPTSEGERFLCSDVAVDPPPRVRLRLRAGRTVRLRTGAEAVEVRYSLEEAPADRRSHRDARVLEEGRVNAGTDRTRWAFRPTHSGNRERYLRFFVRYRDTEYAVFYVAVLRRR